MGQWFGGVHPHGLKVILYSNALISRGHSKREKVPPLAKERQELRGPSGELSQSPGAELRQFPALGSQSAVFGHLWPALCVQLHSRLRAETCLLTSTFCLHHAHFAHPGRAREVG